MRTTENGDQPATTHDIGRLSSHARERILQRVAAYPPCPSQTALAFRGFEQVVLEYGRPFTRAAVTTVSGRGPARQCYDNALAAAVTSLYAPSVLTYCEGYAWVDESRLLVEHAWVVDSEGRVIDPTWSDVDACGYVGVPLVLEHILRARLADVDGHCGVSYEQMYRFGLPAGAVQQIA